MENRVRRRVESFVAGRVLDFGRDYVIVSEIRMVSVFIFFEIF